ncbi:MAG: DUF72 domain-containing protein [Candidatus Thermoplasmatota archaeon]
MTTIFLGTSGWSYDWNLGNSLDWYLQNSGFNAVELNMSFYRFPYPTMIQAWAKKAKHLAWVVKVHRSITHFQKLNKTSFAGFTRFRKLFTPLEDSIDYYLFQLPPSFVDISAIEAFIKEHGSEKIAVEFRHESLFTQEMIAWGKKQGVLVVSIDSPELPTRIMSESVIYERIHGKTDWYQHDYSDHELYEIKERIFQSHPDAVYIFFNNDHMLKNAQRLQQLVDYSNPQ